MHLLGRPQQQRLDENSMQYKIRRQSDILFIMQYVLNYFTCITFFCLSYSFASEKHFCLFNQDVKKYNATSKIGKCINELIVYLFIVLFNRRS